MLSANIGATVQLPSKVYGGSYTCCMIVPTRSAVDAMGSRVCGSATIARLAAPPLAGAANVGFATSVVTSIALSRTLAAMECRTCEAKSWGNETADIMAAPRMDGLQFKLHRRRSVPPRAGMLQTDSARENPATTGARQSRALHRPIPYRPEDPA